ncbi:MAG: hypothetical protein ACFFD4_33240 [Candidatus Odinarchaeota archaeon]
MEVFIYKKKSCEVKIIESSLERDFLELLSMFINAFSLGIELAFEEITEIVFYNSKGEKMLVKYTPDCWLCGISSFSEEYIRTKIELISIKESLSY